MNDYVETRSQPLTKVMVLKAYGEVRANKGRVGVDGMTWAELDANLQVYLYAIRNRLNSGSFFHAPVLQVEIPKKSGGVRPLCIPTLLDRIAQQVVRDHLEKQLEPIFHGSSAHDAVAQSQRNCFNHDFAIDLHIKSYIDTIDHDLMIKILS